VLPGAFLAATHGVISHTEYVAGVHATMRVGGCNCSRGGFIAMCLAAQGGLECIPKSWCLRTTRYDQVLQLAQQLADISEKL